eukprot:8199600-Lingulodinium_polyedra.AAC.2
MDAELVVELTRSWDATFVVTTIPDLFLLGPTWADIWATCVPAGGDGYAYVCQSLLDEKQIEEPTVVAAFDLPGTAVQQLIEALRAAGAHCMLILFAKDQSPDSWHGRPRTAALAAARLWGARVTAVANWVQ